MLTRPTLAILIAAVAVATCRVSAEPVDFVRDVAPLFQEHCIRCHHETQRSGELSLTKANDLTESEFVVPGAPAESPLLLAITAPAGDRPAMPKEGTPLSPEQVDTVAGKDQRAPNLVARKRRKDFDYRIRDQVSLLLVGKTAGASTTPASPGQGSSTC